MGKVSAEQTVAIIEAVAKTHTETINYWWLLLIGIIPVVLAFFLNRRKTLSKGKKK